MRTLSHNRHTPFSCGVTMLTGFGMRPTKERLALVRKDLAAVDGHRKKVRFTKAVWDFQTHEYTNIKVDDWTPSAAIILVSLNTSQAKFWEPVLKEYGYKTVVDPIRNPNSGSMIRVYARTRVPKPEVRKSRKKKETLN